MQASRPISRNFSRSFQDCPTHRLHLGFSRWEKYRTVRGGKKTLCADSVLQQFKMTQTHPKTTVEQYRWRKIIQCAIYFPIVFWGVESNIAEKNWMNLWGTPGVCAIYLGQKYRAIYSLHRILDCAIYFFSGVTFF